MNRIQELLFAPDFKSYGRYTSLYTGRQPLENIAKNGGEISLALLDNKTIVGFAVLDYPGVKERWAHLGGNVMMELSGVEVLRDLRHNGIARHLLFHVFSDPELDQKIICLSAYSWTWDLEFSGLSVQSYRHMLIHLYTDFGFMEYPTNEPNICLKSENFFMARPGKNISEKVLEDFKWLRFGICF